MEIDTGDRVSPLVQHRYTPCTPPAGGGTQVNATYDDPKAA